VAQSVLEFRETGQAGGNTGCNGFQGAVSIEANNMQFGLLASTKRMCAPAINGQETVFLEALGLTRNWQKSGDVLELLDAGDNVVMMLISSPVPPQ
jgi:heat shock protein HslJ